MEYPIRENSRRSDESFFVIFWNGARVDEKCRARLRAKSQFLRYARKNQGNSERFSSTRFLMAIVVFPWINTKDFGCLKNICYNKRIVRFIMTTE